MRDGDAAGETRAPALSVVVPTFNRPALLRRLLGQLLDQTLARDAYELIVVDDGSTPPAREALAGGLPAAVRLEAQPNAGAAAARHRGALAARGEILVFVDDDMEVDREYLAAHAAAHPPGSRKVVLGRVRPPQDLAAMPLFERWHQWSLQRFGDALEGGRATPVGTNLYTGNVSMRRADYVAVGGFDATLGHSEDAELGVRLEKAGVAFEFVPAAWSVNGSDHTSLARWRRRAELYGIYDTRISRKHGDVPAASPWRFWPQLSRVSRPVLVASALVPPVSRALAAAAYAASAASDRLGARRLALAGTTFTFGLDYYRGVRAEMGSGAAMLRGLRGHLRGGRGADRPGRAAAVRAFRAAVAADHATVRRYEDRYGHPHRSSGRVAADAVQKIGLQMMVAIRAMRLLRDAGDPLAAKVASRLIRHAYGADVHWDAELEPGVVIVHGMGLAISHAAHVSSGCILFQNVTLGMGIDPVTRETGAPRLERDVHVMPGATLIGPIVIGAGSKIGAGSVVTRSIPPGSVVAPPEPDVRVRERPGHRERARSAS